MFRVAPVRSLLVVPQLFAEFPRGDAVLALEDFAEVVGVGKAEVQRNFVKGHVGEPQCFFHMMKPQPGDEDGGANPGALCE